MLNNCCYTLAVRQRTCQNGVARITDNVYTNISNGSTYNLSFGYKLTIIDINTAGISIKISNPDFIPSLIFNIPSDSYKIFDLPKESGTLRVYIGIRCTCCEPTRACCNNS